MIKAVVFDMGGVLVGLDFDRAVKSFKEKAGFDTIDQFLDPWHQRGFFREMESGTMSEEEFCRRCLELCRPGTTPAVLESCLGDFLTGIDEDKVALIKELYKKYDLYLLSNNNPISIRCCEKMFREYGIPMDKYFKKRFISSEMKMVKPNRDIYEASISAIGCKPDEIFFIDDSKINVDTACSLGIHACLYTCKEDFISSLGALL